MRLRNKSRYVAVVISLTIGATCACSAADSWGIQIAKHPQFDAKGSQGTDVYPIQGTARGIKNPADVMVVIYAKTDQWYIQPYGNSFETALTNCKAGHCEWSTETHLGKSYLAILARRPANDLKASSVAMPAGGSIVTTDVVSEPPASK